MARATAEAGESFPCIEFIAEAEQCPVCASTLQVQKSKRRQVFTLQSGVLNIKEVRKKCSQDATHPVMCSDELSRLVKPHQRYAYDLVVGPLAWLGMYAASNAKRSAPSYTRNVGIVFPTAAFPICAIVSSSIWRPCTWRGCPSYAAP
jgi:hypothetical protein